MSNHPTSHQEITREALSTGGRAKSKFPSVTVAGLPEGGSLVLHGGSKFTLPRRS
jgi:hypothetical protein